MKKYSFLLLMLICSYLLFAQPGLNTDSLWNVWTDKSQADTSRVRALLIHSFEKYGWSRPDSIIYYAEIALSFADDRDLKWEMAWALQRIGAAYVDLDSAMKYLDQSLALGKEINDKKIIVRALHTFGSIYYKNGDQENARMYYEECIPLYEDLRDSSMVAHLTMYVGNMYMRTGDYSKAIEYLTKSLEVYELRNESKKSFDPLFFIGYVYMYQENYVKAIEYFEKCRVIAEDLKYKKMMGMYLSGIAAVFEKTGEYDKALESYQKGLALSIELDNKPDIAVGTYNIGNAHLLLEDYEKSLEYLFESLKLFKELKYNQHIAMTQGEIGKVYLKMKNYNQAIHHAEKGLDLAKEIGVLEEQNTAVEVLYKSYKAIGVFNKALTNHEKWWVLSDSLNKEETGKKLQQFEFDRQRTADSLAVVEDKLRTELAFQQTLSAEKQTRNAFMYAGLAILLIAVGLFSRMRYIRRTNKQLEEKNKLIAAEKAKVEEIEKAKEQFFNNISHEFRTPLTLILGPLNDVLNNPDDPENQSKLEIMQRSALRLQGMINELLDLSKLDFGSIRLQAKEENIVKVTKDYLQSFESFADQRKIILSFRSEAKEYKVWLDLEKFRKMLANLLSNAFKFTKEGGRINITIGEESANGIEIKITDTGIGISPDKLPHIFDRFFQVGDKSFTKQAGTGIGLALTKELVELHNGTITVESKQGSGATFTILIPTGKDHLDDTEIATEETKPTPTKTQKEWVVEEDISGFVDEEEVKKKNDKPIVLITEDNPDMLAYIKSHLEDKYKILKARDGEEGLAIALEKIPDLVISDVMMPRMDGNMMTEKLKTDQRTSHIPVILLTARASVDSKIEGLETGADAYLTKPFNARELKVRVKNLIAQRKKLRALFAGELNSGSPITTSSNLPSLDQKLIQKAIDVVNEHMADTDFDVTQLAGEMALSRSQLHRKIKGLTDKTTGEFIRTIRLNKAAELLRAKADTVSQIAYETGFNNLSWFAKAFKEQYGVSPSEYMKTDS